MSGPREFGSSPRASTFADELDEAVLEQPVLEVGEKLLRREGRRPSCLLSQDRLDPHGNGRVRLEREAP